MATAQDPDISFQLCRKTPQPPDGGIAMVKPTESQEMRLTKGAWRYLLPGHRSPLSSPLGPGTRDQPCKSQQRDYALRNPSGYLPSNLPNITALET